VDKEKFLISSFSGGLKIIPNPEEAQKQKAGRSSEK
jgi:hypothetical protein